MIIFLCVGTCLGDEKSEKRGFNCPIYSAIAIPKFLFGTVHEMSGPIFGLSYNGLTVALQDAIDPVVTPQLGRCIVIAAPFLPAPSVDP